jgi:DNA processing protein
MSYYQENVVAATWSILCEPGDGMAGLLRNQLGTTRALALVSSSVNSSEIIKQLPLDDFRSPKFENTLTDCLEIWRRRLKVAKPELALDQINAMGGTLVIQGTEFWPTELEDLGNSTPSGLWVLGAPECLKHERKLSVIGSRLASDYGLKLTQDLVRFSVSNDWLIVSGGAVGIDAKASKIAMDEGHRTIAVLAGGLDKWYPAANSELFQRTIATGCLVSEMPPGYPPSRWRFLQRNRLIAALSKATLVVEAGFRSGSINTAGHANELGRPVGAVPGPVDSARSAGCHRLIREGRAELISTPEHLLELMGASITPNVPMDSLTTHHKRAMDSLSFSIQETEQVALKSGLTLRESEIALARLKSIDLVVEVNGGWRKN